MGGRDAHYAPEPWPDFSRCRWIKEREREREKEKERGAVAGNSRVSSLFDPAAKRSSTHIDTQTHINTHIHAGCGLKTVI